MNQIKERDIRSVAEWIAVESNNPYEEIEWLLKVAYTTNEPALTFQEAWGDVLTEKEDS